MLSVRCLSVRLRCLSCLCCPSCLFARLVYCRQAVGWIKMKLSMEVGLGPGHNVLDGDQAPPLPQGQSPTIFDPCLLWPNGWLDHDVTYPPWYGGSFGPGDIVLDGYQSPRKKGEAAPTVRPMYGGKTVGWIKMPLGTKVGHGPGHIVLDGDPAPPKRGTSPIFGPCLLWPNGWIDQDAT